MLCQMLADALMKDQRSTRPINYLWWMDYITNSVDKTKQSCNTPLLYESTIKQPVLPFVLFNADRILHERNTSPSRRSHHDKACTWNVSLNKALFAIRGLARAFLRPRESIMPWVTRAGQRSAYYCQTLGKPLLDSTQTFPRKAKDASCSTDDEGLFAGISMRSSPKAWLTFRAAFTLRVTHTSRCLALDSHFASPLACLHSTEKR